MFFLQIQSKIKTQSPESVVPVAMFSGTSYSADLEVIIIQLDFFKVMIQRLFLNIFYLVNEGREGNPRSNPRYDQTFTQFTLGLNKVFFLQKIDLIKIATLGDVWYVW